MSGRPMSSEGSTDGVTDVAAATADYTAAMDWLDQIKWDRDGLVPVIAQEQGSNDILMFAWMNREALQRTLETGRSWFWSRSRKEYWCKGETSGDRQFVRRAAYDCDVDVVLLVVEQEGRGACHTGARSCFFRDFGSGAAPDRL